MPHGKGLPGVSMLLACLWCALAAGCSKEPLYHHRSPDGTWAARTYGANRGFHVEIERIVILEAGHVSQELRPPVDEPLAIADDGSLYLGRHHGHLHRLHEVYVYREGSVTYLGDAPFPGFGHVPHWTRKGHIADHWQEWERQMKTMPRAGPACLGLRLLAKPRQHVFAASKPVLIDLTLYNVGREDACVPDAPLTWVAPQLISFSGHNELADGKLKAIRMGATPETPDEKLPRTIKTGAALRRTLDLGLLPLGEYTLRFGMDQSWRREQLGRCRWDRLSSNETAFEIR